MADITLSSAVRNNLLSLQNTADLLGKTQERLATGLKVNSALDDPTAFFTAASLESRSSDLNRLLDSAGLAVQTIRAADTGIGAITDLVESAQATARQALQTSGPQTTSTVTGSSSATFNPQALSAVAGAAAALTADASATVTVGAAIGGGPGDAAINETGADLGNGTALLTTLGIADGDQLLIDVDGTTFTVDFDNASAGNVIAGDTLTIDLDGGAGVADIDTLVAQLNTLLGATATVADPTDGAINFTGAAGTESIRIRDGVQGTNTAELGFTAAATFGSGADDTNRLVTQNTDIEGLAASNETLQISLGGNNLGTVTFGTGANQVTDLTGLVAAIDGFTGVSAAEAAGVLTVNTTDVNDADSAIVLTASNNATLETALNFTPDVGGGAVTTVNPNNLLQQGAVTQGQTLDITIGATTKNIVFGTAASQVSTLAELTTALSTTLNGSASVDGSGNISVSASNAGDVITLAGSADRTQFGLSGTQTEFSTLINGTGAAFTQGDQLTIQVGSSSALAVTFGTGAGEVNSISELNSTLSTLAGGTATLDNTTGAITVSATNTADSITIGQGPGTPAAAFGLTPNTFASVTTNSSDRAARESEFNDLLTQIDQLARDSSFNGNNLLQSDDLTVIFNEDATSSLTITGVDFDSGGLGISAAATDSFQTDANINGTLTQLETATATLRTQAATFGSNLSIVEVREQFTKELTNVLETGAANLTLADTNEEGANLLALQTRQQLSTVALSLASQADQQVLLLF
ncbi:MAG: flagellin [Methyloligellaceae bacterium]